jgi:O-antigen ligase
MISIPNVVLFVFLVHAMIGLAVLASPNDTDAGEGLIVRQIIFAVMCTAIAPLVAHRLRYVRALCARELALLLIVAWSGISLTWALAPDIALRRWILVVVVVFLSISLCALINSTRRVHLIALAATGAVMLANYFVVLAMPEIGLSSEARGTYWSGLLPHKNSAGLVASLALIVWFFAWRRLQPSWLMLGGAALWLGFLLQTGSRTSQFALLVALGTTIMLSLDNRHLRRSAIFTVVSFLFLGLLTIMIGLLPAESVVEALFGDTTFTGRTVLWSFLISQVHERPLAGVGVGSFWGVNDTSLLRGAHDNWFATTVQGHNGYLDITVTIGVVGLVLCLAFLLSPFRSLAKADARLDRERRVYCAIWIFGLIHNCAESSILRGDSILWVLLVMSVVILRSTAPQSVGDAERAAILRVLPFSGLRAALARPGRERA